MPSTNKLIRAVAYPRYSSDNQREESIVAQMRAIEAYCQQKGYVLVNAYPDEEKTATTDRRPNFQRMIEDSNKKLFDVVIVHKLDRFARNRYDSAHYKRVLKRNGVRVESVLEHLDNSPESVILESVLEGMAEYYSLNLSREVRKGLRENAEQGTHTGGRPPYGLKVNPVTRMLEIDEQTYKAVQIYFDGIEADLSNDQIAAILNEKGYRTLNDRSFTSSSFATWGHNRKYKGDYTYDVSAPKDEDGKRNTNNKKPQEEQVLHEGRIPAIISSEQWDRVYRKLQDRKRKPGRMKAKVNYLLTGKIYCGACGALYSGNSYTNKKSSEGTVLTYYKCQDKCGNTSVRKDDIEAMVIQRLIEVCFSGEGIQEIIDKVQELYQKEKQQSVNDIEPIKRELAELEGKLKNWIEALGAGIKTVIENIKQAEQRKEALEYELDRAEVMQRVAVLDDTQIRSIIEMKKNLLLSGNEDEKKQVLQEYVDRVVIQPSSDINRFEAEITYRVFTNGAEGSRTPVRR
ncbi:recombinase family protein [Paenibacillus riograndensis]|uniref:Site-specific recombinase, DNA invertase Pin n=1 Tax=Paenibacillus riograndensis SBR5 TaxID=1073571 RepID=A0A0E4CU20_9BACL|nr:recombinase family protein [Paenibacillus riograndensis]CQR51421.1 site-specific recombinase, DNA invertase Pin [Paenibacillus riograndensis SBR5]